MAATPDFFIWTTAEELGSAVLTLRNAAGLSRQELARRCGVGYRFLYDLERGKGTLRMDKVMIVLRSLGIAPLLVPAEVLGMLR